MSDDEDPRFGPDFCMFDEPRVKPSALPRRERVQDEDMSGSIRHKVSQIYRSIDNTPSQESESDISRRSMGNETSANVGHRGHSRSGQMPISTRLGTGERAESHTRKTSLKSVK